MQHFIVERISDGVFVELDLPVKVDSASQALSGPGMFSGTVEVDDGGLRTGTGELLADQRKSFIHEEVDGVIRNTWLVSRVGFTDEWKIQGKGFSSYLDGYPYEGEFRGENVDMADVVRHVWAHAQRLPNSNLGVTVTGMTGVKRGTDSDRKADAAKADYDAKKAALKVVSDKRKAKQAEIKAKAAPFDKQIKKLDGEAKPLRKAYQDLIDARKPLMNAYTTLTKQRQTRRDVYSAAVAAKRPAAEIAAAKAQVDALETPIKNAKAAVDAKKPAIDAAKVPLDAKNAQIKLKRAEKALACEPLQIQYDALKDQEEPLKKPVETAKDVCDKAKEKQSEDGGAWKILWWDTPDCGSEVQDALDEAGWEFVEWSGWNADRTKILKEIRLQKRVGRQQSELRFVESENITDKVVVESTDAYANTIAAVGAGEGKAALRVTVGVTDGCVRTPGVLDAKSVTRLSVLEKLARAELARRSKPLQVSAVTVDTDHPNALRGTFGVGDSILIDCEVSWLGRQQIWHRIKEIEWTGESTADLFLEA